MSNIFAVETINDRLEIKQVGFVPGYGRAVGYLKELNRVLSREKTYFTIF
ncbi:MAG: hypothetical protein K0S07_129 [Chlamydiales bacterium]|jgi:hypothetical protein|nr:hypothetical protein [Chlamydiales bacterium]